MDPAIRRHNFYIQVLIIVLGLGVLRLWMIPADSIVPAATAQGIPDSGAQREQQIALARTANELLGRIEAHLREGTLQVLVVEPPSKQAPSKTGRQGP